MRYSIKLAHWTDERDALLGVRFSVFVDEQGVPAELEHDARDADAWHLLACDESGQPIGTGRMLANGHIGRMAVLPGWRGRGVGTALLDRLMAIAREHELDSVFLHAQISAIPFYARLGFTAEGQPFEDAGIQHLSMTRKLDR